MGETLSHILFMHLLKRECVYIYAQTKKAYQHIYVYDTIWYIHKYPKSIHLTGF